MAKTKFNGRLWVLYYPQYGWWDTFRLKKDALRHMAENRGPDYTHLTIELWVAKCRKVEYDKRN